MSTGIDTIDAAPLIIRTYNDDSANNTFLLTRYDYPVSSNFVLRTSSDGSMAPSDALTQTTMGLSSMTISKHYGSTMVYDAFNASTLFLPSGVFDTITKTTMTASSITASTIYLNVLNISTINAATFSPNGVSVAYSTIGSTVQASSMVYSTLLGDSLFVNTIGVSTLFGSSMYGRSWAASTMVNDNAMFSTLIVASTAVGFLSFSTLQGSTLVVSTLSGSSIYTNPLVVSTLDGGLLVMSTVGIASTLVVSSLFTNAYTVSTTTGSSMNISTVTAPSLLSNSLVFSTAQGSTLVVSTLTMSSLYVPLVIGSTIQGNALVFSTLSASSMNTVNVVYSTAQGSTMTVSTTGVSTLTVGAVAYSTFSGSSMTINTMGVSTVAGSTISWNRVVFSTIQGSSATVSSVTVSTLVGGVCAASSAQGSTLVVSSLVVSSMNVGGFVGSTLKSDSLFFSTMTVSTLSHGSAVYSTLQGSTTTLSTLTFSTLSVSTTLVSTLMGSTVIGNLLTISSIQFDGLIFSTLNGSTLLLSTLTSCTINAQTISVSTLQGSTFGVSTLTGSTMVSGQISYSTLIGSTIITDYISASTFTGNGSLFISTFSFAAQQTSAAFLSTLIVNSTVTVSTLNRINPTSVTASTLTLSGGLQSNTTTGLLVCSTLTVNAMNLTRSIVNQPVYGNTVKIDSIAAPGWSVVRTSGIRAFIDAAPSLPQTYTFGPAIPDRWIAGFTTTNTFAYSNDGFNWVGLGTTITAGGRIAVWNGTMWVAVGDIGSITPALSGNTLSSWTQNGVTWTATASSTSSGWAIYNAFNTSVGSDYNAWAAGATNYNSAGTYTGAITTTVNGIPVGLTLPSPSAGTSIAGDWLQIQSSTPLSILSYTWGCANAANQIKSYCLVGSNDGTTWYFIQYVVYSGSPCTNAYASITTPIIASYTGTQTVSGNMTVSATTTSSSNSGKLYTYFRMIGIQMFSGSGAMYMETGEWAITFSRNTIAYSYDGIAWTGLGTTIFTSYGLEVVWSGSMWVAVGGQKNSIAYSYDGINWTGLGNSILTAFGHAIAWNGTMFVAVGQGTNTIAYSYDGINWTGLGATTFTTGGYGVAWNGRMWIAVGSGTNTIAYSYDGVLWVGLGVSILNNGVGAAWNGVMWVTLSDSGTNAIAYSYDGINWTGLGTSMFSGGRKLAWNGNMWLAAGTGTNTLVYSYNGINWFGLGTGISTGMGYSTSFNSARPHQITFPASMMVATGSGTNTLAYSADGVSWTGSGLGVFSTQGNGVASNGSMWVATGSGTNTLAYSTKDIETPYIYLPFENGLSKDVMGNSTTVLTGSISYIPGVRGSSAVNFVNTVGGTGSNYLKIPWTGSTSFSISFWFNAQTINGIQQDIFTNTSGNLCFYINSSGNLGFYIPTGGAGSGTNATVTSYTISTNTWYNVTGIFQAYGLCSLYVNNTMVGRSTNIGGLGTGTMDMWMGSWQTSSPFNGFIDDIRIYNYAITMNPKITWRGLGTSVFSTQGKGVAWNGSMWVAVGGGTNSIAYSYDGITWMGLGTSVLTQGNGVAWNGAMWIAVGNGTNSIGYSYNGITWTGLGTSLFSTSGNGIAWNGSIWVTVGSGTNTIAYSYNGTIWTGLGTTLFSSSGNGIAWNGNRWVAVGSGTNTILYSTNGINWSTATSSCFTGYGSGITWNGTYWVATGSGTNTIGYSTDGSTWIAANVVSQNITPNQTGLASNTWTENGITWTSSASRIASASYPAYGAFNNYYQSGTGIYSWASPAYYNIDGLYTLGPATNPIATTTTVQGVGSISGEWLQIQSSAQLVLTSYSYATAAYGQFPKTYYIVGSNDNSTWYPIQRCVMTINPFNARWAVCRTYIVVNQSGTQTVIGGQTGSGTFTTYSPYTTTAYTYFRLIGQTLWDIDVYGNMEVCELYLNFNGTTHFSTAGSNIASNIGLPGTVNIQHPVVAVGQGIHTIAYSPDGIRWIGLGISIFSIIGYCVAWNGSKWLAGGLGSNTLAYSYDGYRWTGLGNTVFLLQVKGVAWNGSIWVAVGSGTNTVAFSMDGLAWTGSPSANAIFTICNAVAWNGVQWVAVGVGTNAIAYSADGFTWTAIDSTVFSTQGNGVCWTGSIWIAVGSGTNTIAYSTNGSSWTGLGTDIFSNAGNGVCWNGTRWVAVGSGTNTIAYSPNGTTWFGFGTSLFPLDGNGVCWTGTRFVAVGSDTNTIGYSADGLTWYAGSNNVFTQGNGVAGNPRIGAVVCDSQVALSDSTTLDVVSDTYYNTDYTNFSATIQAQTYTVDPTLGAVVSKTQPDAPTNVSGVLYPIGAARGIQVSFTYPSNTGGGVDVYYASAIDTAISNPQKTVTIYYPIQPITLTSGLVPGTTYKIQVYSYNSAGKSVTVVAASNILFQVPPSVPQNYTVALNPPTNPTGVIVSFTAPSISGGVTSYAVTAYQDSTQIGSVQTGTALSYIFTGFTAGIVYNFSAVGINSGGIGMVVNSSIMYYTRPDTPSVISVTLDPPTTPTGVSVVFTTNGATGGGALTYVATAYDSNSSVVSSVTGSMSPLKITGLTAGTSYTYRVVASNPSVSSAASIAFGPLIYYTQPATPSISSVTFDSSTEPTGIIVAFTTNGYNGGGTLTYVATAYLSGVATALTASGSLSPLKITGLTPGTSYTYKVVASNASVSSNTSVASSAITYYTKPDTPNISSVTLDPPTAPTGVNVIFTSGATGGGTLTYVVTAYDSNLTAISSKSGSTTTLKITGLTAGTSYTYRVVASNPSVSSAASISFGPLRYYNQPAAPSISSVTLDSSTEPTGIIVAFTTNGYNGGGTLTYVATAYLSGVATALTASGSLSPLTITGLTSGIYYKFTVIASNGFAFIESALSSNFLYYNRPNVPSISSVTLDPPTAPTGVSVTFATTGPLGGTVTYVATAYNSNLVAVSSATGSTSPLIITGLTPGTSYTYRAVASNPYLSSAASVAFGPTTYATNPSVPQNASRSGNTVTWTASLSSGGVPLLNYIIKCEIYSYFIDGEGNAIPTLEYTNGIFVNPNTFSASFPTFAGTYTTLTIYALNASGLESSYVNIP